MGKGWGGSTRGEGKGYGVPLKRGPGRRRREASVEGAKFKFLYQNI